MNKTETFWFRKGEVSMYSALKQQVLHELGKEQKKFFGNAGEAFTRAFEKIVEDRQQTYEKN